jgi:hypothetical protein
MKTKWWLFCLVIFVMAENGYSQDTSKSAGTQFRNNSDTANQIADPNAPAGNINQVTARPHSAINTNKGTAVPSTTSGTLNSTMNPNTQFVIPLHKKRKPKAKTSSGPDTLAPK